MRSDTDFLLEQITFSKWGSPGFFERRFGGTFPGSTDRHGSREQGYIQGLEYSAQQRTRNPYFT